jgi:NAD-dependent dihydropyrimidine dehydrogenase PreA subunit
MTMSRIDEFVKVFQVPPAMVPYAHVLATVQEMDLVVGLAGQALSLEEVAEMLRISPDEARGLLRGAMRRDLVDHQSRAGVTVYAPGKFYTALDYLSSVETGTWKRLPMAARREVAEWQVQEFIKLWLPAIERVVKDPDAWLPIKNRDVLLLEEAMALVEASPEVCLLPCSCRTTSVGEGPLVEGSMRVGERARQTLERGQGRRLSTAEAQAHLVALDRMGLVHTGPHSWREHDPGLEWISHGNCDPSYSYIFIAGMRLGLEKLYPRAHYVAAVDWDRCTHCAVCTGRCPFGALYQDGTTVPVHGQTVRQVQFDVHGCWGCGLCATTCPEAAIRMRPL